MGRTYNYDIGRFRTCAGCGVSQTGLDQYHRYLGGRVYSRPYENSPRSAYLVEVTEPLWEAEDCSSPESVRVVLCGEAHSGRDKGCLSMNGVVDKFLNNERLIRAYGV